MAPIGAGFLKDPLLPCKIMAWLKYPVRDAPFDGCYSQSRSLLKFFLLRHEVEDGFYWDLGLWVCIIYWGWRSKYQPREYTDRVISESAQTFCIDSLRVLFLFPFFFFRLDGQWTHHTYHSWVSDYWKPWIRFQWFFTKNGSHHLSYRRWPVKALFDYLRNPGACVGSFFSVWGWWGEEYFSMEEKEPVGTGQYLMVCVALARSRGSGFYFGNEEYTSCPEGGGRGKDWCWWASVLSEGRSGMLKVFPHPEIAVPSLCPCCLLPGDSFSTSVFPVWLATTHCASASPDSLILEVIVPTFSPLNARGSIYPSHLLLLTSQNLTYLPGAVTSAERYVLVLLRMSPGLRFPGCRSLGLFSLAVSTAS